MSDKINSKYSPKKDMSLLVGKRKFLRDFCLQNMEQAAKRKKEIMEIAMAELELIITSVGKLEGRKETARPITPPLTPDYGIRESTSVPPADSATATNTPSIKNMTVAAATNTGAVFGDNTPSTSNTGPTLHAANAVDINNTSASRDRIIRSIQNSIMSGLRRGGDADTDSNNNCSGDNDDRDDEDHEEDEDYDHDNDDDDATIDSNNCDVAVHQGAGGNGERQPPTPRRSVDSSTATGAGLLHAGPPETAGSSLRPRKSSQAQKPEFEEDSDEFLVQIRDDSDVVTIGAGGTTIPKALFIKLNWRDSRSTFHKLIIEVFGRDTLANNTLSGKPSPAFIGMNKPQKGKLDPVKVADVTSLLVARTDMSGKEVRHSITSKCADESKALRNRRKSSAKTPESFRSTR